MKRTARSLRPDSPEAVWNRLRAYPHILLIFLIVCNLVVAAFIFDDYGESWDEPNIYAYAQDTERAYVAGLRGEEISDAELGPYNLRNYGPAYFVFSDLFARSLGSVFPQVKFVDFWHLSYFISFLVSVICLYALCLRWVGRLAALAAALLFNLQPLLWGHAFINPKDIPFMAFFLLSVALGLRAADLVLERRGWAAVLLAGLALGVAAAMRVSAPLAGLIVAVEIAIRGGKRSAGALGLYALVAGFTALLLWPYLWGAPVNHYLAVLNEMRDFPMDIPVKFDGGIYSSLELPLDYLPRLLLFQMTGPALLMILAGVAVAIWRFSRRSLPEARLLLLMAAWFVLPLGAILWLRPTMYDNFRQFIFLLPPLFIFASLAMDELLVRTRPAVAWTVVALAAAPGLLAMVALHPFEYTHYNRLAGEPGQIQSRFETDYWVTSYRQAIEYLNEVAPPGARVFLYGDGGPAEMLRHFGRADLTIDPRGGIRSHDYAIITTRSDIHENLFYWAPVVFQVERQGMVFVVVKQVHE